MTDHRIGAKAAVNGTSVPKAAATKLPVEPGTKIAGDSFMSSVPTEAQLNGLRKTIAALDALPKEPLGIEAKKAWIAQVKPAYEAAVTAEHAFSNASFFHKNPPEAEADMASAKVAKLGANIQDAEEAAGLRKTEGPQNPFRPLFGASAAVKGWMGNNAFTAIVGLIALIPATVYDVADMITRPIQAAIWPAQKAQQLIRDRRYEAAHPNEVK